MTALDRISLIFAALILGFAVFSTGGVTVPQWNICLAAVSIVTLVVCVPGGRWRAGRIDRITDLLLILLPAYVTLQLVPLPLSWLRILSPARAALTNTGAPIGLAVVRAPLSVSSPLTMTQLLRLLCFVCVFFIIRELTRRLAGRLWLIALPILVVASGEALLGLVQYFSGVPRATGTYVNANHFSCLLLMALPFTLAMAATQIRRSREREEGSLRRVLLACLLLALGVLIFLGSLYSLSRMGLGVIAASIIILLLLEPVARGKMRKARLYGYISAALLTAVLMLALFFSAPGTLLQRLGQQDTQDPLTADLRFDIWRETLPLIRDYPVFGSGMGTYASVFQKYRASSPLYLVDYAHNDYLQLLSELGLVGFTIAAAIVLLILIRAVRGIVYGSSTADRLLAAACVTALVAIMLDSSVDFDFYIPANAMLAAWIAGLGTAIEC